MFWRIGVLCFLLVACLAIASGAPPQSNLTLSVESVPVKTSGKTFLQRLNVQVSSAWNKFKCQFYTKATVPVSKMLNVKIPTSLEMQNITSCHQLDVLMSQMTNASLADQMATLATSGTMVNTMATALMSTTEGKPESTSVKAPSIVEVKTASAEMTTSAAPEATTVTSEATDTTTPPSTAASSESDPSTTMASTSAATSAQSAREEPVVGAKN